MPPSTACTCASSFTLTSTWASSWPTLACPASSLPGPKTNKDSSAAFLVSRSAGLSPRFGGHAFSVPVAFTGSPDDVCREARHLSLTSEAPSLLHKQNAIIILRPVIHDLLHLQSRRAQLLDHNLLRNPVSAPVARNSFYRIQPRARRKINNPQPPSRLQPPHQAGINPPRLLHGLVHAPQDNRA